jgi:hypothetical protein
MKKWLFRLIWAPVLIVAVLFLVANRQPVAVSFDPISANAPALTTPALPLWLWFMLMLFVGFFAGAAGMWMSGRPRRAKTRAGRRELKALRHELSETQALLAAAQSRAAQEEPPLLEKVEA